MTCVKGLTRVTRTTQTAVPVAAFADYVVAAGPARPELVRQIQARQIAPYNPATDFYRGFRKAIVDGRRVGDDRAVLEAAIANAHEKKKASFRRLTGRWLDLLDGPFAGGTWTDVQTARWTPTDLGIKVSPIVGLSYPDGCRATVFIHFAAPVLRPEVVRAELRVMEFAAEDTGSDAIPVLVELQRGVVHRPTTTVDAAYDAQLIAETVGLSFLMNRLSAA